MLCYCRRALVHLEAAIKAHNLDMFLYDLYHGFTFKDLVNLAIVFGQPHLATTSPAMMQERRTIAYAVPSSSSNVRGTSWKFSYFIWGSDMFLIPHICLDWLRRRFLLTFILTNFEIPLMICVVSWLTERFVIFYVWSEFHAKNFVMALLKWDFVHLKH